MAQQTEAQECLVKGLTHLFEFVTAAFGYQCFVCSVCGHAEDVIEDSQP